jgi:hypothetical protein
MFKNNRWTFFFPWTTVIDFKCIHFGSLGFESWFPRAPGKLFPALPHSRVHCWLVPVSSPKLPAVKLSRTELSRTRRPSAWVAGGKDSPSLLSGTSFHWALGICPDWELFLGIPHSVPLHSSAKADSLGWGIYWERLAAHNLLLTPVPEDVMPSPGLCRY